MAKLTFEQAKIEFNKLKETIDNMAKFGIAVPDFVQAQFDALKKQLEGNASAQVAELFTTTIGVKINGEGNEELKEAFAKAIGNGVRLKVSVSETGDITFEAAGTSGGGGGTSTGNLGGTRSSSAFNHWKVTNLVTNEVKEYPAANQALKAILNGGSNPMNLPAEFGSSNSAVRVLQNMLPKNPLFAANYTVVGSKVEKAETVATEPEPTDADLQSVDVPSAE